jgi:hypothetical protein
VIGVGLGKADVGENAVDEVARHLSGALRVVVEGGHDGEDRRSGIGGKLHVSQMNAVERGFADAKDEAATLLEADVGGALDEVRGHAVGDSGQRSHGAGKDDHAVGGGAATGDGGSNVGLVVLGDLGGRRAEELFDQAAATAEMHLFGEDAQGGFGGDEVDLRDARVSLESAKRLGGEERATSSGDGKSEAERCGFGRISHVCDYRRYCDAPRVEGGRYEGILPWGKEGLEPI